MARNVGIELIRGDYTTFIDSDDWIHLNMIKAMVEVALDSGAEVVGCKHLSIKNEDDIQPIDEAKCKITVTPIRDYLKRYFRVSGDSIICYVLGRLYKSSLIKRDMFPVGLTREDILGTYRAIKDARHLVEIDFPCYYYYLNPNSITSAKFSEKNFDYFPVLDIVISESSGEIKEFAQFDKVLFAYTTLLRMAKNGVARSKRYSKQKAELSRIVKD